MQAALSLDPGSLTCGADIALLQHYKSSVCGDACASSPLVTFGGSMAGTLAALMRLRAPWLVHAAWASSTPLLGFVGTPNLDQYAWRAQITTNWRDVGSAACVGAVRAGFAALAASNASSVAVAFGTCEAPFEGNGDLVRNLAWSVLESSGEFVYPPASSAIPSHCAAMTKRQGLGIFAGLLGRPGASCLNLTRHAKPTPAARAWNYLACTEVIHPIGSNNESFFPPGKWSVAGLEADCIRQFGAHPRPRWLPTAFGLGVRSLAASASRIMFAYGSRDPWARLGVGFTNLSDALPVVAIEDGSHCADVAGPRDDDTAAMRHARELEVRIMRAWLGMDEAPRQEPRRVLHASLIKELRGIAEMHNEGLLTDSEFAAAKARALAPPHTAGVMIRCGADGKEVLTVNYDNLTQPIDLRSSSICPEVISEAGYTTVLTPLNIPESLSRNV